MDSPPDLTLSPPTPSPIFHPTTPTSPATPTTATSAAASAFNVRRLATPLQNPKKKRTKVICFQLQHGGETSSSSSAAAVKPKPAARKPDPSAPKITMPCSECGKKFWSWKALYGHMRCHPDRQWRGIHPPHDHLLRLPEPSPAPDMIIMTPEDHEAASCLLLLANSPAEGRRCGELAVVVAPGSNQVVEGAGNCGGEAAAMEAGHRCGICWKVFSSGQALGGHKRCHWDKNASGGREDPPPEFSIGGGGLDLNLPAQPIEQRNDLQLVLRLGI